MNLHQGVSALPESSDSNYVNVPSDADCVWLMNEEEFKNFLEYGGKSKRVDKRNKRRRDKNR